MSIRIAKDEDFARIWPFFQAIAAAGDTYGYDPDIGESAARALWMDAPRQTFVFEEDDQILGSYYITSNHDGPGGHVCNCGYMVDATARGRGIAATMCEHSQQSARSLGYRAMQFNFVASSNTGAVRLWTRLGFETVGRLPRAFRHPELGYVDALVLYKWLAE